MRGSQTAAIFIFVEWLFWWLFGLWLPENIFLHRRRQGPGQGLMLASAA